MPRKIYASDKKWEKVTLPGVLEIIEECEPVVKERFESLVNQLKKSLGPYSENTSRELVARLVLLTGGDILL